MTTNTYKMLPRLAAIGLLMLGFAGTATAGDLGQRVSTGVGQIIAAQGNAALEQIREDLRERIEQTLQPLTPAPRGVADAAQANADRPA